MNFAMLMSNCGVQSYGSQQSVSPFCVFRLYAGNRVLANTVKKHFLRSGLLNKGQRFALKALEVLSSGPYSRLVDILCKAEISVSRKIPYLNVQTRLLIKTA